MEAFEREVIWTLYRIATLTQNLDNLIFRFPVFWILIGEPCRDLHSYLWVRFLRKVLARQERILTDTSSLLIEHEQMSPDAVVMVRISHLRLMQGTAQNTIKEIKKAIKKWERVSTSR